MFARLLLSFFVTMATLACAQGHPTNNSHAISTGSPLAELDAKALRLNSSMIARAATRIGRPDRDGRIGRNRSWRHFASVRFQYGAGRALRYAKSIDDAEMTGLALDAIDRGLATVEPDGGFPVSVPPQFSGQSVSLANRASAAAFFLSDVCSALVGTDHADRRRETIAMAIRWLMRHQEHLFEVDKNAPNRLLINALAMHACGLVADEVDTSASAQQFVDSALRFYRSDGVILEQGGSDTSYQAVSLSAAIDLIGLGYGADNAAKLHEFIDRGGAWLRARIGPDGKLDSSANTRTCAGEEFLGTYKQVDVWEVYRSLSYAAAFSARGGQKLAVLARWMDTQPDPCS